MKLTIRNGVAVIAAFGLLIVPALAFAANTPNLTQTINAGTLNVDILDASRVAVASPTFAVNASTFSFNCQTVTGTLGSGSQRIYATNPGASNTGFTVTMAATAGNTTTWSAGTPKYDFNDASGSGCTDGADTDSFGGQLTVDPSVGTVTADYTSGVTTGVALGTSTPLVEGTADSVTLINAGATSADTGRWYLTGVGLSQTVPAEQAVGSYSLPMTLTITAQ